jgi:hypothetical protein
MGKFEDLLRPMLHGNEIVDGHNSPFPIEKEFDLVESSIWVCCQK